MYRRPQAPESNYIDTLLPHFVAFTTFTIPWVYETYQKYYGYKALDSEMRKKLQSEEKAVRNESVNVILNDLMTEQPSGKNELHYNEHASAAYDYGFFDIMYKQLISNDQDEQFIRDALKCMKKMIKSEKDQEYVKRHQILSKHGIKKLFSITVQPHDSIDVTEASLELVRTLSRFDRFRRWTIDDVPNGSQGCVLLGQVSTEEWRSFLGQHLSTNNLNVQKCAIATLAHAAEYPKTARLLSQCDAISQLVNHLSDADPVINVKSLIAISKVFEAEPAENAMFVFHAKVISDMLKLVSRRESAFMHPPDEITEHSIVLILYTLARRLLVDGDRNQREEFTKMLCENQNAMLTIFMMTESSKQSSSRQISEFIEMTDSQEWSDNYRQLKMLRQASRDALNQARMKYQQKIRQQRQQQMQGMGGMGGMGGMMPPGMMG